MYKPISDASHVVPPPALFATHMNPDFGPPTAVRRDANVLPRAGERVPAAEGNLAASDSESAHPWCELIRDVAAIANSGGGAFVVRWPSLLSSGEILAHLAEYSDSPFDDIEVRPVDGSDGQAMEIVVGAAAFPIAFKKSADCRETLDSPSKPPVFTAGSVYFRYGDDSQPATSADLQAFVERILRRMRRRWLRGIRNVVARPLAELLPRDGSKTGAGAKTRPANLQPVRIVTDPAAPALQPQDVDRLYPWRQKDLLRELNTRLGRRALNSYDIQAVRRQHRLDERPDFVFNLPGAGRRYSPVVADWIMQQLAADPQFFHHARAADQALMKLRRQKPLVVCQSTFDGCVPLLACPAVRRAGGQATRRTHHFGLDRPPGLQRLARRHG